MTYTNQLMLRTEVLALKSRAFDVFKTHQNSRGEF